jgi:hypothetical protein
MQNHLEPSLDELLWTVAAARIMFGPAMNIQAPPNLTPAAAADTAGSGSSGGIDSSWRALLDAGINDWGKDHHQQQQQQQTFIKGELHFLVALCYQQVRGWLEVAPGPTHPHHPFPLVAGGVVCRWHFTHHQGLCQP